MAGRSRRLEVLEGAHHRGPHLAALRRLLLGLTGAQDAIFEIGRGNLRATDRLALKALQVADRRDCDVVDHTAVIEARRALWP